MQPIEHDNGTFYILDISTDNYAGNFEREMAGYLFGKICAGQESLYKKCALLGGINLDDGTHPVELDWFMKNLIRFNTGDHDIEEGWWATCDGPKSSNNVSFLLRSKPTDDQLRDVLNRARNFAPDCKDKDFMLSGNSLPSTIHGVDLYKLVIVHDVSTSSMGSVS